MNILIIGASSFIGAYQVEQLINTPDFVGGVVGTGEILDLGIIMKVSVCLIIILMYVIMILLRF